MRASYEEIELVAEAFSNSAGKGWVRVNCPLCEDRTGERDRRMSMGLNTATGGFICHRCQATGAIPEHLRDLIPFHPEDELTESSEAEEERTVQPAEGYVPLFEPPNLDSITLSPAREYLLRRGLSVDICKAAKVGAAVSGYLAGRVIVPVLDLDPSKPWLGWVARDYVGGLEPRYRYPKGMRRDRLWNERALYSSTDAPLLAVEGVFDALPYWPNVVAFLGKPTKAHRDLLIKSKRPVVIALDGDAWEEGWALAQMLQFLGVHACSIRLPPKRDPGDMNPEELWALAREKLSKTPKS